MSQIHDRVMVALANTPGKQRTVKEIVDYVNNHFIRGPYTPDEILSALQDLADQRSVQSRHGRWLVADGRRKGSGEYDMRRAAVESAPVPMVKRVNRR